MLIENPHAGCFLCKPEAWRVIYDGDFVRLLAGLGPLAPGYVLLAPKEHVNTVAELSSETLSEFLAISEICSAILAQHYGPGYTAYEHGKVGACATLEQRGDFSSFCHHAHRVFVPRMTDSVMTMAPWFNAREHLNTPFSIRNLVGANYVYYETGIHAGAVLRFAFREASALQSQFMRRILTTELQTGRSSDWGSEPRYEEMIDTTSRLRGDFFGLASDRANLQVERRATISNHLSIDGLCYTGKSFLASSLAQICDRPLIETGMYFRRLAFAEIQGTPPSSADDVAVFHLKEEEEKITRRVEHALLMKSIVEDPRNRAAYEEALRRYLRVGPPSVILGRDAWRFVSEINGSCFFVDAEWDVRCRRRVLNVAKSEEKIANPDEVAHHIALRDETDIKRMPPIHGSFVRRIYNGRRDIKQSLQEILFHINPS